MAGEKVKPIHISSQSLIPVLYLHVHESVVYTAIYQQFVQIYSTVLIFTVHIYFDGISLIFYHVYTWICPKCEFFNFPDSFFGEQVNLETKNRFVPLTKEKKDRSSPCGTNKSSFISGLKFISMNINSIRGKNLEWLAFLDFHQPHVVAIQETKIDSSIATSELFPETCPYSVYRKD